MDMIQKNIALFIEKMDAIKLNATVEGEKVRVKETLIPMIEEIVRNQKEENVDFDEIPTCFNEKPTCFFDELQNFNVAWDALVCNVLRFNLTFKEQKTMIDLDAEIANLFIEFTQGEEMMDWFRKNRTTDEGMEAEDINLDKRIALDECRDDIVRFAPALFEDGIF